MPGRGFFLFCWFQRGPYTYFSPPKINCWAEMLICANKLFCPTLIPGRSPSPGQTRVSPTLSFSLVCFFLFWHFHCLVSSLSSNLTYQCFTYNYCILLSKLANNFDFPISAIFLIQTYITDRLQRVSIGNHISPPLNNTEGAAQRSILFYFHYQLSHLSLTYSSTYVRWQRTIF